MHAMPTSSEQASVSLSQLFSYPFRIFFLSLTVLAIVAIPVWVLEVTGVVQLPLALPALFWHQHEMLFGFLSAAIAGFLLTAVCVWTQTNRTHGALLAGLWGVWLAGRLLLAFGGNLPDWLVQGVNLAFLPLVMVDAGLACVEGPPETTANDPGGARVTLADAGWLCHPSGHDLQLWCVNHGLGVNQHHRRQDHTGIHGRMAAPAWWQSRGGQNDSGTGCGHTVFHDPAGNISD